MSDIKFASDEMLTTDDGRKLKVSMFKAQLKKVILQSQRNALKNLKSAEKSAFYHKAYEILDKNTLLDKKEPIMQIGLSPYTFMQEPVTIGNFQTTYGELFSRMHQALKEAEATFDFGGE